MKFRKSRSIKGSVDLKPQQHTTVSEKNPTAIQPPKKVIRALYDYQVPDPEKNSGYLSFSQGDFLHVIGRENDPDWYRASNPLHDTEGLVPVNYFEEIGKQVRKSSQQAGDRSSNSNHDSGYAERESQRGSVAGENGERQTAKSAGKGNVAMIYGTVLYDFRAERPDELEAKAGENIVVIAQSTSEWFVAKPITRLGGPGLIPVSFVEIRDTSSGLPVVDVQEAVHKAGIPRVEEWKKMVADYKNSSIPLGRLEAQNLAKGMDRLNLGSGDRHSQHDQQSINGQRSGYAPSAYSQATPPPQQQQFRTSHMIAPVRAKVTGYSQDPVDFWFHVEAVMEDGRIWNISRSYKDFYGLQLHLIEQFPEAAGKVQGHPRTLPYMPGPVPWVTENLTSERRGHLDRYIRDLLRIDSAITNCQIVRMFFYPRETDFQVQPEEDEMGNRMSAGSRASSGTGANSAHTSSGTSTNLSIGGGGNAGSGYPNAQRQAPYQAQSQKLAPGQYSRHSGANQNGLAAPPPLLRPESSTSDGSAQPLNNSSTAIATPVKVKVWFGESNCVIIRLAANYNYADLVSKLRDRWSLEPAVEKANAQDVNFAIEYRDDDSQQFHAIEGDEDLAIAKERNEKLTLRTAVLGMM